MKTKTAALMILAFLLSTVAIAEYVPFKVKLNALERLVVGELLPKQTSFANWKVINDLKMQIAPTEEELALLDPKPSPDGTGIVANWEAVPEKEITFGEVTEKMVIDALEKLDSEGKLMPEHLTLYEKFIMRENNQ